MLRKFLFLFCLVFLFIGAGCQEQEIDEAVLGQNQLKETVYTAFIINVHDWVYIDKSAEVLNKVMDLSDEYQIPIDVHLDDEVTQLYLTQAPEVLERLKNSPLVAVSFQVRQPSPYYWDYDWLGLEEMDKETLYQTIKNYEEHKIDLVSGQPTEELGGYELVKEIMGYAPFVVSGAGKDKDVQAAASRVWAEKGATFIAKHSGTTQWGEKEYGLWVRPEDLEVKVYEGQGAQIDVETMFSDALSQLPDRRPAFLNLKWHENNFYSDQSTFRDVYGEQYEGLQPPFDLSKAGTDMKTAAQQAEQWARLEGAMAYVKNHPEIFTAVNARILASLLPE